MSDGHSDGKDHGQEERRQQREERRKNMLHDRLANLIEENRMLKIVAQDDADEIQRLKIELESLAAERNRLGVANTELERDLKVAREELLHLEHAKFVADVQARTIDQQDRNISQLIEENKNLNREACQYIRMHRAARTNRRKHEM